MVSQMEDFTSSRTFRVTGPTAFAKASITHCDVDHLMIYDVRCSQLGEASRICRSTASRIWALCRAPRPAPSSPSATRPPAHQIVIPGQVTHAYLLALAVATKGQFSIFDRRLSTEAVRRGRGALHIIGGGG